MHPKYRLYRVPMKSARAPLTGVPVLFVPGHGGSYKQARSLGRHLWDMDNDLFDVFALEFNEEPTGLNGNFITDQATYLNDVVRAILQEYRTRRKTKTTEEYALKRARPESVMLVAHSMGGIVARTAEALPNYKRHSIQHVVALGVPYEKPSFVFDAEMNAVYDRMHAARQLDDNVVYVSIAGGHKDTLVQTSWTSVDTVADPSRAFAALASAIPIVKTPVDHFCLVWCHQLLKVVAQSLYEVVDPETRKLVSSPSARLAIAKKVVFGQLDADQDVEIEAAANVSLHRAYVQDGYYPGEYTGYALSLPLFLAKLLRTKLTMVVVIMYALALQIFCAQVSQWQSRFDLQTTSGTEDLHPENFPSFTSMLHPWTHAPAFFKNMMYCSRKTADVGVRRVATASIAALTLALTAWALYLYNGGQMLTEETVDSSIAMMATVAEFVILYAYALGLLYALTTLFSLLQRFVVLPLVSVVGNVTDRLKLRSWMLVVTIHATAQLLGHFTSSSPWSASRILGLLVLASFVVFVVYTLALGGDRYGTSDQQRMQRSLFAVLWLSIFSWVGKMAYFAAIARFPPPELSNSLLMEGGSYVVILSMYTYLIHLSLSGMIPLPPTAFFGASSGQDAASVYGKSSSSAAGSVKITAENCPKCVFEDGGPGAVFVEYSDTTTHCVAEDTAGGAVYVGPTFRVVLCDCVYRFKLSRDFCDFCIRSCRLCGGGNGNFQEAAKYKVFLEESKVDMAMHAIVPMAFQICAAIQATYGLYRSRMFFYLTPVCALALVVYHVLLRHPIEARRIKNKQRKRATKRKKSPGVSTNKPTSAATVIPSATPPATSNETAPRTKKKNKRKPRTSLTSSASPPKVKDSTAS